jgi:hypothetical protein
VPNYIKNVNGVDIEMTDEEHAVRLAEEKAADDAAPAEMFAYLRYQRNRRLLETDFYALSDVTMSDEMALYRDQLRKLPNGLNDETVMNFTWPTKP